MRSLSVLCIIGFVAAGSLQPYSWTPSKEYKYKYSSQVLTGIPELNHQFSGLRLSSTVRIQPKHDSTLKIQLEEPRLVTYNDKLEWDRDMKPINGQQEQSIPSHIKTWLETPFVVFHKRGLVEKIELQSGEPEFVVNLKKGLVSQIQMDLTQTSERRQNTIRRDELEHVLPTFTTFETSILGQCETEYTISKLPEQMVVELKETELKGEGEMCQGKEYFEILRTKNLDKCINRPVYHKSIGTWAKTDGSKSALPTQSSVTRTFICGSPEDHHIVKSMTVNKILYGAAGRFETNEKIDVASVSVLELESIEQPQREISGPSSPRQVPSLVYEYPIGSSSKRISLKKNQHAPLPDLTSAPHVFATEKLPQRELKQKVVELFKVMIETAEKFGESTVTEKDAAGMTVSITKVLSMLSLEELKEVEQTVIAEFERSREESHIKKVFFDLVSMAGTNPCIMLVKEKITSGEVTRDPASWSWILSNTLRNVRTPTPELLKELIELAKSSNIQRNRIIRAAYLMGLTGLINKACINYESMENQFPYRIYGQMCHEDMEEIKSDLIPYLTHKLQESVREDMNSVITYVNALGNLGTEETTKELLKVVEKKIETSPYPRSIAVYKLMKPAMSNPSLYRPILLSIIENSAENEQVRMAAITTLIYASPSSADLQKLALRTWFEPSKQVKSYIYSTLTTLSKLSSAVPEYDSIKNKAQIVLPMAMPIKEGIQYSHNLQFTTFVETLKTAVSHKLQWVASEDSFIPRSIYANAELLGASSNFEAIEANLYMQGSEWTIEKLYDLYSNMVHPEFNTNENNREIEEILRKVGIQGKRQVKPEAHFTLKFMGLQKLYSVDEEVIQSIVNKVSTEVMEDLAQLERGLTTEYFKVLDLFGADYVFPTESGMPVEISVRHPTVAYNRAEIKAKQVTGSFPMLEVKMKGVTNYKRQVYAGVTSPMTEKFYGTAVETSMHLAAPLKAELTVKRGQVQVTLKQREEPEYQKEISVVEFDVHPFTFSQRMQDFRPISQARDIKTIESRVPIMENEMQIGKPFGLDVWIKSKSEEQSAVDVYSLWESLRSNVPVFLSTLPTPVASSRRSQVKIVFNPMRSEVKELDLFLTAEAARTTKNQEIQTVMAQPTNEEIERICMEYTPHNVDQCVRSLKQKIQHQDSEVVQQCEEEKTFKQQWIQQQQQNMQKQQQHQQLVQQKYQSQISGSGSRQQIQENEWSIRPEEMKEQCLISNQLCKEERKLCLESLERENLSRTRAEVICSKKVELCKQNVRMTEQLKEQLHSIKNGNAVSISMGAVLRGRQESEERKMVTYITIARKPEHDGSRHTKSVMKTIVKTPSLRQPYEIEIHCDSDIKTPVQKWNLEEILRDNLTKKVFVQGHYGYRSEEKKSMKASIMMVQSDKLKHFLRETVEYEKCSRYQQQGRLLTESCKESRQLASSLDVAHVKLYIPTEVTESRVVEYTTDLAKLVFFPYISQTSTGRRTSGQEQEYEIEAWVNGEGNRLSVEISGDGETVKAENVRVPKGLFPTTTEGYWTSNLAQKLTGYNAPSQCTIEGGKVRTFDKFEYSYSLNDCEHVVFSEMSSRPRVLVATKKDQVQQYVKMIVDGHKFEVELKKESRYSRDASPEIKVNGEKKQWSSTEQDSEGRLWLNEETYAYRYMDGVYTIYSVKYGVEVLADGERLEVLTPQHIFRNRVSGLCGDLNGEWVADVKTGKQCVVSKPKTAAFSFLIENGKCQGIPQHEKTELEREQQRCIREEVWPTTVVELYQRLLETRPQPEQKHIIQEFQGKTCISKSMVRVCPKSHPKHVQSEQVGFTCVSGPSAEIYKRRVESGDLVEELLYRPAEYVKTIYVPKQC